MREFIDAVTTRIQAPYFGYSLVALLVLNWRAIFLLFMLDAPANERIAIFEQETSFWTIVALPLLAGAVFAILTPWSRYVFEHLSQKPFSLRDRLQINADHQRTILQTELEEARSELFGQKEEELIDRARRDDEIANIEDEEVKQRLVSELAALRAERDKLSSLVSSTRASADPNVLSKESVSLIKAAANNKRGTIMTPRTLNGRSINAGDSVFGDRDAKSYALYESALEELEVQGYVKPKGSKREIFELTHKGWQIAESL